MTDKTSPYAPHTREASFAGLEILSDDERRTVCHMRLFAERRALMEEKHNCSYVRAIAIRARLGEIGRELNTTYSATPVRVELAFDESSPGGICHTGHDWHDGVCCRCGERQATLWRAAATEAIAALPDDLRAAGWSVAVHNDYRLAGENHTFWLLTHGNLCVKGEGRTDREALAQVRKQIAENPLLRFSK